MLERIPDSEKKKGLIVLAGRTMLVVKGAKRIEDASDGERNYLAALIDGEGSVSIPTMTPLITVGMKNILPYMLGKEYGGCVYKKRGKREGRAASIYYYWDVRIPELLRPFIVAIMPFSRVKHRQLELLLEAVDIKIKYYYKRMPNDVRRRFLKIKNLIHKLNEMNPPDTKEVPYYQKVATTLTEKIRRLWLENPDIKAKEICERLECKEKYHSVRSILWLIRRKENKK